MRGPSRFDVCGVTYGPFSGPDHFTSRETVQHDFAKMRQAGINTVRVYTVPPGWLLDDAAAAGLMLMIGLCWEQHVTFLADESLCDDIERNVRSQVKQVAGHPAIFCYIVGNEIAPGIVRWHKPEAVERFIHRLFLAVKQEDPLPLVTYANFPSTQYLHLPFLDFVSFNIYLENRQEMTRYLASLHHECSDRPLLLSEVGLDSSRNGAQRQADVLDWQVRSAFIAGCAGVVLFSWTDEWTAAGVEITDWCFGLTTRDRTPKPALAAITRAFSDVPFPLDMVWPRVSVVVCTYNGSKTLRECLTALAGVDYPQLERIVVNDGSTDSSASIAAEFPGVRLINQKNMGLSAARNAGMLAAEGEYIAYLDDDARVDPLWLKYLMHALMNSTDAGVGGPNLPCPEDGLIAGCVALSPGNPTHIMLNESEAEHIPGCNMAFRKSALLAVGGFDPQFWIAGDDVDLCWRLQEQGMTIGFAPTAVVWHHRRQKVRAYLRQQMNYGKAEAELERKWPHKYNVPGHLAWKGRLYARGPMTAVRGAGRKIFYGAWGSALFQTSHPVPPPLIALLPSMPDWYLLMIILGIVSSLGLLYPPLLWAMVPLGLVLAIQMGISIRCFALHLGRDAWSHRGDYDPPLSLRIKGALLTAMLHALQPLARFWGRTYGGLTPWRWCEVRSTTAPANRLAAPDQSIAFPFSKTVAFWSEHWQSHAQRLERIKNAVRETGVAVRTGGSFDRWDLEVRGGVVGAARLWSSVEEHGQGKQLTIIRIAPRWRLLIVLPLIGLLTAIAFAWRAHAALMAGPLLLATAVFVWRWARDTTVASRTLLQVLRLDPGLGQLVNLQNRLQRPVPMAGPVMLKDGRSQPEDGRYSLKPRLN